MRKQLIVLLFMLNSMSTMVFGQLLTQSPYSRFGLGDIHFQGFADQQAMGQTGVAFRNPLSYSILNPASYSALTKTNFKFGVNSYFGTLAQNDRATGITQKLATNGAALNYFTLGFQLNKKKNWGVVFGATPYSSIGYTIRYQRDSASGNFSDVLTGRGEVSRFFVGTGKSFGQHFSVGFQASFLHGQANYSRAIEYANTLPDKNYRESSEDYMRGFMFEGGAQYYTNQRIIKSNRFYDSTRQTFITNKDTSYLRHQFGATYRLGGSLRNDRTFFARTYVRSGNNELVMDTIMIDPSQNGRTTLPSSLSFGYSLVQADGKWRLAVDYALHNWSEFKSPFETQNLRNAWQAGIGFAYRPSTDFFNDKKLFLLKTEYRMGFRYGESFLNVHSEPITDLGISFGLGVPLRTRTVNEEFKYETVFSSLDVSVEYHRKGTLENNLIQEDYWRFVLGVSLNDKWFNKRKIE